ncbi:MAG: hypothetical protein LBU37_03305 [Tannerellaceae bacterium]|jgi:hypothetical protein|nr:hypothetical protein [Tannerellaceae bacterium]
MMNRPLNSIVVDTIIKYIPDYQNPVEYIMDILDLGKDSIYRRINGKIPFTFEELAKLSKRLNFSLDVILKDEDNLNASIMGELEKFSPKDILINKLQVFYNLKKSFMSDINSFKSIASFNKLYIFLIPKYENLFKYYYYRWIYQIDDLSILFSFSELKVPGELIELQKKLNQVMYVNNETNYIMCPNALSNTVRDIQYFYKRELITKEELILLKEELLEMMRNLESTLKIARNEYDSLTNIFVSTVSIDSSILYIEHKETKMAVNWYNQICPIFEYDLRKILEYKIWLDSLKKFSTLISRSNYEYTAIFIKKQIKIIESMDNIENT